MNDLWSAYFRSRAGSPEARQLLDSIKTFTGPDGADTEDDDE